MRSGEFTVMQSKGAALVPLLNRLGFDAMTGHWDFAYGPTHLRVLMERLWITCSYLRRFFGLRGAPDEIDNPHQGQRRKALWPELRVI